MYLVDHLQAPHRAKGITKGVTKATPTNPYGTHLNPNKHQSDKVPRGTGTQLSKKDIPLPPEWIPVDARPSQIQDITELEDIKMTEDV